MGKLMLKANLLKNKLIEKIGKGSYKKINE